MPREALLRKWKVISPRYARWRIFSKCAPLDYNLFFSKVYNILASFSDLTNPPVQYSIYVENRLYSLRRRSQETARVAFVACSSLFENLHLLRTEPSHCQDFDHLIEVSLIGNVRMELHMRLMQRRGCLTLASLPENETSLS